MRISDWSSDVCSSDLLVQLGRGEYAEPNVRATQVELHDGLEATSLNAWPNLRMDIGAATGLFAPLLGAGFYYKTFMPSQRMWQRIFEPAIRRMAGQIGRASCRESVCQYV